MHTLLGRTLELVCGPCYRLSLACPVLQQVHHERLLNATLAAR